MVDLLSEKKTIGKRAKQNQPTGGRIGNGFYGVYTFVYKMFVFY